MLLMKKLSEEVISAGYITECGENRNMSLMIRFQECIFILLCTFHYMHDGQSISNIHFIRNNLLCFFFLIIYLDVLSLHTPLREKLKGAYTSTLF